MGGVCRRDAAPSWGRRPGHHKCLGLVVVAAEVGGRFSEEAASFVHALAKAKSRSQSPIMRRRVRAALSRRWEGILACVQHWNGPALGERSGAGFPFLVRRRVYARRELRLAILLLLMSFVSSKKYPFPNSQQMLFSLETCVGTYLAVQPKFVLFCSDEARMFSLAAFASQHL